VSDKKKENTWGEVPEIAKRWKEKCINRGKRKKCGRKKRIVPHPKKSVAGKCEKE